MYDLASVEIITNFLTIFFATVFTVAFLMGFAGAGEQTQTSSRNSILSQFEDDDDMYAILSGDEEYLAAHVTLKEEPLPKPKPKQSPLLDDCKSALVSLGVPSRKAKAEVDIIMQSNPSIKTVQDFITEYGKR